MPGRFYYKWDIMTAPNISNTYLPPVICVPSALEITAITRSFPMVVSTTMNSDQANIYIPGMAVILNIPWSFGMWQAIGKVGTILAVNGSNITLDINSTNFDPFVVPSSGVKPASLSPYGSRNLEYNNSNSNVVPFKNLNNIGN